MFFYKYKINKYVGTEASWEGRDIGNLPDGPDC